MSMFFVGMMTTILVIALVLMGVISYLKFSSQKQLQKRVTNKDNENSINIEINRVINDARKRALLESKGEGLTAHFNNFKDISLDIATEISKRYNPNSKYPSFELTFYELLKLNSEVTNSILEYLENDNIKYLKDMKVCHLMQINDVYQIGGKAFEKYSSEIDNGKKIVDATSLYFNPLGKAQSKILSAAFEKGMKILCETSLKTTVVYGVTKLGLELDSIYAGKYSKK
ncbi:hypothetical protein [Cetobacterium sp.]|uniref:hypothetical protein n=1 Tax=Cetobacterium sp. TaxID=2071632 RepID=UPI003F2B8B2B